LCTRCGIEYEENSEARSKRKERNSPDTVECRDCRGLWSGEPTRCRGWSGDFDWDTMQPLRHGRPYLPGVRTCGRFDCVTRDHIIDAPKIVYVREKFIHDYHGVLAKTLAAGLTPCNKELCGRPVHAVDMCRNHYYKAWKETGGFGWNRKDIQEAVEAYRENPGNVTKCGIEWCDRKHRSKNLCDLHYQRVYRKARYDAKRAARV
jgi:hypothetical protein